MEGVYVPIGQRRANERLQQLKRKKDAELVELTNGEIKYQIPPHEQLSQLPCISFVE